MTLKQKFDQFVEELQANDKIELDELKWKPGKAVSENEAGIKFLEKPLKVYITNQYLMTSFMALILMKRYQL